MHRNHSTPLIKPTRPSTSKSASTLTTRFTTRPATRENVHRRSPHSTNLRKLTTTNSPKISRIQTQDTPHSLGKDAIFSLTESSMSIQGDSDIDWSFLPLENFLPEDDKIEFFKLQDQKKARQYEKRKPRAHRELIHKMKKDLDRHKAENRKKERLMVELKKQLHDLQNECAEQQTVELCATTLSFERTQGFTTKFGSFNNTKQTITNETQMTGGELVYGSPQSTFFRSSNLRRKQSPEQKSNIPVNKLNKMNATTAFHLQNTTVKNNNLSRKTAAPALREELVSPKPQKISLNAMLMNTQISQKAESQLMNMTGNTVWQPHLSKIFKLKELITKAEQKQTQAQQYSETLEYLKERTKNDVLKKRKNLSELVPQHSTMVKIDEYVQRSLKLAERTKKITIEKLLQCIGLFEEADKEQQVMLRSRLNEAKYLEQEMFEQIKERCKIKEEIKKAELHLEQNKEVAQRNLARMNRETEEAKNQIYTQNYTIKRFWKLLTLLEIYVRSQSLISSKLNQRRPSATEIMLRKSTDFKFAIPDDNPMNLEEFKTLKYYSEQPFPEMPEDIKFKGIDEEEKIGEVNLRVTSESGNSQEIYLSSQEDLNRIEIEEINSSQDYNKNARDPYQEIMLAVDQRELVSEDTYRHVIAVYNEKALLFQYLSQLYEEKMILKMELENQRDQVKKKLEFHKSYSDVNIELMKMRSKNRKTSSPLSKIRTESRQSGDQGKRDTSLYSAGTVHSAFKTVEQTQEEHQEDAVPPTLFGKENQVLIAQKEERQAQEKYNQIAKILKEIWTFGNNLLRKIHYYLIVYQDFIRAEPSHRMLKVVRKIRALFPNFHVDFQKYIRQKKSEEVKRIQMENNLFLLKQGADRALGAHIPARSSKKMPQTVWQEVIPLEEMKRTRTIYKGLELDPMDMIIVIAEMSSILKHEVVDLEGSSPFKDSRSSSMRSLRRMPTRLFDEAEEFNKMVALREKEEHEEKRKIRERNVKIQSKNQFFQRARKEIIDLQRQEKEKAKIKKRTKNLDLFELIIPGIQQSLSPAKFEKKHETEQLSIFQKHGQQFYGSFKSKVENAMSKGRRDMLKLKVLQKHQSDPNFLPKVAVTPRRMQKSSKLEQKENGNQNKMAIANKRTFEKRMDPMLDDGLFPDGEMKCSKPHRSRVLDWDEVTRPSLFSPCIKDQRIHNKGIIQKHKAQIFSRVAIGDSGRIISRVMDSLVSPRRVVAKPQTGISHNMT